jgi:hypothetical protein
MADRAPVKAVAKKGSLEKKLLLDLKNVWLRKFEGVNVVNMVKSGQKWLMWSFLSEWLMST